MSKLRVITIDPYKEKIRGDEYDSDNFLDQCKKFMECSTIDIVSLDDENMLILDDDGLFRDPQRLFHWVSIDDRYHAGKHQFYVGKSIIAGYDQEGDTTGTNLDIKRVEDQLVKFIPEGIRQEPKLGPVIVEHSS
jgi:hypothetical protein|tara:strand:+ start:1052 stop:1456 length:405 start_codon:yes stop_codon:yes gene_type:complete